MQAPPSLSLKPNPPITDPRHSFSSQAHAAHHSSTYHTHLQSLISIPGTSDSYHPNGQTDPSFSFVSHHHPSDSSITDSSAYYHDPYALAAPQHFPAVGVAGGQQISSFYTTGVTAPQIGTQQLVPGIPNLASLLAATTLKPQKSLTWKKVLKKQTKVVQSAWCEICKVDCNSKDVFNKHIWGKKHKKNLEKLAAAIAPPKQTTPPTSTAKVEALIGPQENPDKRKSSSSTKAKMKETQQMDLDAKRRKVVEGGAAADAVRICEICNVVCNSETVFRYHLAGQKHSSMMKKHESGPGLAAKELGELLSKMTRNV